MAKRTIEITPAEAALIERLVADGRYATAEEVLREALLLVDLVEVREGAKLKALRQAAEVGLSDLEAGRYRDFPPADSLDDRLRALTLSALDDIADPVR